MSSELSSCLAALRAAFADTRDKYAAHERARPVLLDMAASPAVFTSLLDRHFARADALTLKHYPVVGLDIEINEHFGLVANCWIPLPDRDTNMSTKAVARALRGAVRELPRRRNRACAGRVRRADRLHVRRAEAPMAANSLLRRAVKASLHPVMNESTYSDVQGIAKAVDIRRGTWYEPELDLIAFAVRPGDEVLDLGANYGFYTYHLSRAVGAQGHVYAFEPVPFTNRTLALVAWPSRSRSRGRARRVPARLTSGRGITGARARRRRCDGIARCRSNVRWSRLTSISHASRTCR